MKHYVGLDVSLEQTSICVVDGNGQIVSEGTVISEPEAIAAFIRAKAPQAKRIGLETGPTTTWLWHELRALGLPVICIERYVQTNDIRHFTVLQDRKESLRFNILNIFQGRRIRHQTSCRQKLTCSSFCGVRK